MTGGTTGAQLIQFLNRRGAKGFQGVVAADQLPDPASLPRDSSLIVNYSRHDQPGTHWVAIVNLNHPHLPPGFFGSFGLGPDQADPLLNRNTDFQAWMRKASKAAGYDGHFLVNRIDFQSTGSDLCGWYACFAVLHGMPHDANGHTRPKWRPLVQTLNGMEQKTDMELKRLLGVGRVG
jgi:hypothetical protein